jgi:hypothetical protein
MAREDEALAMINRPGLLLVGLSSVCSFASRRKSAPPQPEPVPDNHLTGRAAGEMSDALRRAPAADMGNQGNDEQHEEHKKENFRDAGRRAGDASKSEGTGDNGDEQEYQRPIKHSDLSSFELASA